jgi:hypothetical protein
MQVKSIDPLTMPCYDVATTKGAQMPEDERMENLTFRLSSSLRAWLEDQAKREGRPLANYVRWLLDRERERELAK